MHFVEERCTDLFSTPGFRDERDKDVNARESGLGSEKVAPDALSKFSMSLLNSEPITFAVEGRRVSCLLQTPPQPRACYLFAHGAGAGMRHPFLEALAAELFDRGIGTFRYQFPYMEQGTRRPDSPGVAGSTVRAAAAEAFRRFPNLPLVAGGKSYGGRMTSQAQAECPLPGVQGLVFLGFPLHPAGRPANERGKHLFEVQIPMLFLQGTRDALADISLMQEQSEQLGSRATLRLFDDADHSFHVRARSGQTNAEVTNEIAGAVVSWIDTVIVG